MKCIIKFGYLLLLSASLLFAACATADVRSNGDQRRLDDQVPDVPDDDTTASDMGPDTTSDLATDPTTDAPSDPVVDPRPDPVTDPTADPVSDPVVDPTIDSPSDPDTGQDPVSDPTTDPTTEPDAVEEPDLPSGGGLFISEICDHQNHPGASFIEVYNATGWEISLAGWSIERWDSTVSRTEPATTYFFPGESLANGDTFVVGNHDYDFFTTFLRNADAYHTLLVTGTGDDAYVLAHGTIDVDVWGVPGTDGSFEDWDLRDDLAKRNPGILIANSTWQASEWTITVSDASVANPGNRN